MKLLIFNIPETLNYGSMMMAENLFYYLAKELQGEELELVVVTPKPEETVSRLREALNGGRDIHIRATGFYEMFRGSKARKLLSVASGLGFEKILSSQVRAVQGVAVLGGDDFSEDYGYLGAIQLLVFLKRLNQTGRKVVLCGQTIGPFHSWRKPVFRCLLRNVALIISRDPVTFRYLTEELRLKNAILAADLAFLPLARENDDPGVRMDGSYFTIVPSGLIWRYAKEKDWQRYVRFLADVGLYLLDKFPSSRLLLLPHVVRPDANDDSLAGRDLQILLKRRGVGASKVVFIEEPLLPFQARRLMKESKLVFTGRMHAAISSLVSGVPALSLSYSRKYWGIIAEYLGLGELVVDVREMPWDGVRERCLQALDYMIANQAAIRSHLADRIPEMQSRAFEGVRWAKRTWA